MKTNTHRYTSTNREGDLVTYSVPVIRHVWEEKRNDYSQQLVEKIRSAKSETEVKALVEKGIATQKDIGKNTVDKWKRTAERRLRSFAPVPKLSL